MMTMTDITMITTGISVYLHQNRLIWKHIGLVTQKIFSKSFNKSLQKYKYKKALLKRDFSSLSKIKQIIIKVPCEKYISTLIRRKFIKNSCKNHENRFKNCMLGYFST